MTAKLLAMSLVSLALGGMSCSGRVHNSKGQQTACGGGVLEICRETYPGVFKLDLVDTCDAGATRTPEENEVPLSYCQPCQDKQAATMNAMDELLTEGAKCQTNEDCAVVYVTPACNFGCGRVLNKDFDAERYNGLAADYNSCTLCKEERCLETQDFVPPRCDKGRCVMPAPGPG